MILYATPWMVVLALIPMETNGEPFSLGSGLWGKHLSKLTPSSGSFSPSSASRSISGGGAAVGTDGWVEMDAKIDMRAIVALLEDIPDIRQIVNNITDRIETFDTELVLAAILPTIVHAGGPGAEEVNVIINELIQNLHKRPLDSLEKKLLQLLEYLRSQTQTPLQCNLAEVERGLELFAHTIEDHVNKIQQQISVEITKDEEEIVEIHHNGQLLETIINELKDMSGKIDGGEKARNCDGGICSILSDIYHKEVESANLLHSLTNTVQKLPGEIVSVINSEGGLGGLVNDIQTLIKIDEGIKGSIGQVGKLIMDLTAKSETYFNTAKTITLEAAFKIKDQMSAVSKAAASTEQVVQKFVQDSARAARNAGRNANCKN